MVFHTLRWHSPQSLRNSYGVARRSWYLSQLLPWLLLLAGTPALAQISQSRGIKNPGPSSEIVDPGADTTEDKIDSLERTPSTDLNFAVPSPVKRQINPTDPPQAKASLDSPPSPEIAATLCDNAAQSFSGQVIITSETVCQSGLTPPSLWWTKEQVAQELRTSGKLVTAWSAQLKTPSTPGQVRLIINPQMWSLMDYFERYDFVNSFGLAARGFGYQTQIYNTKGNQLASYICTVQNVTEQKQPESANSSQLSSSCRMSLGSSLNFGYRGSRSKTLF